MTQNITVMERLQRRVERSDATLEKDALELIRQLVEALVKDRDALMCSSCFGTGSITTVRDELDECPDCHGERSDELHHINAAIKAAEEKV